MMRLLFLFFFFIQLPAENPKQEKSLSFSFNRFYTKENHKVVECTISNPTDSVFWVIAYNKSKEKEGIYIHPVYDLKEKKNGIWKAADMGFIGTGLSPYSISPGEKLLFESGDFDSTAEIMRIGIEIRTEEHALRPAREIWTEEINLH
jgi:hypothetical protein